MAYSCLLLYPSDQVAIEPASRNQQVVGGKRQKRKRIKKEIVKIPRRKRKGTSSYDVGIHPAMRFWLIQQRWTVVCVYVCVIEEPKKRSPAHDEADHRALKRMTRQRVNWSLQEDSLMMLCSVASHLLNSKVRTNTRYCTSCE